MSATGINWGSLLPLIASTGASLYGASQQNGLNGAAQNAARNSQQLYNFGAGTPSGVGGTYTANPGGLGGNVGLNFGNLTGANNQLQGLAGMFAGAAGTNQVPSALTNGANNAFGVASGNINPANANANNFFGAANTQLNAASQDPTAYANGVYKNLTAQAKPWEDAQTAALQDSQFGKGQAGTSGGALQTQAFAQGLGTADLQRQITAQQMGQQQQQASVANASNLSGAGSSLLQNAFSNFNTTQNQQQQLAALPAYLQSLQLQNSGSALTQQAGIQGQAQSLFNTGLNANTSNGNLLLGAAGQLGANANGANTGQSPYGNLLQSLFGSAANSATDSTGSSLLKQLFGNSSAAGGEAAGTFGASGVGTDLAASTAAQEGGVAANVAASNAAALGGGGAGAGAFGAAAGASEPALASIGTGAVDSAVSSAGASAANALGAGTAGAGSGGTSAGLGAVGGGAAALAIGLAPALAGLLTSPVTLTSAYWDKVNKPAQDILKTGVNASNAVQAQQLINAMGSGQSGTENTIQGQLQAAYNKYSSNLMASRLANSGSTPDQLRAAGVDPVTGANLPGYVGYLKKSSSGGTGAGKTQRS